jgi:hypothetical protein
VRGPADERRALTDGSSLAKPARRGAARSHPCLSCVSA